MKVSELGGWRQVGDLAVAAIPDGDMAVRPWVLYPDVNQDDLARHDGLQNADGDIEMPYGGFLVKSPDGRLTIIDLGAGPRGLEPKPERTTVLSESLFMTSLRARGVEPDDVTDVVITHLHRDHIGWASIGGLATFANADYAVPRRDWGWFVNEQGDERVLDAMGPVEPQLVLWESEQDLTPWLRLVPAIGHTPGNSVVVLSSAGASLAIVGDVFHGPVELTETDWHCGVDWDPERSLETRATWTRRFRKDSELIVGPHFPGMVPGRLDDSGWHSCGEAG